MTAPTKLDWLYAAQLASVNATSDLLDVASGRNPTLAQPFRALLNAATPHVKPAPSEPSGMFLDHSCWKCQDGKKSCVRGTPTQCEYPHARND